MLFADMWDELTKLEYSLCKLEPWRQTLKHKGVNISETKNFIYGMQL